MQVVNLSQAKSSLGRLLDQVKKGAGFIIAERNVPVAVLKPLPHAREVVKLKPGVLKGQFVVPADFDQPLIEFERDFYGE
ncbi:MAG: type II toxin-antitoxin system Phd/YefM family antitoxin [Spirochaetales bacterium]|nr:type II toxin-antitoxin system Phd/YefM family antitoxin [Spirochaetales bacterium]